MTITGTATKVTLYLGESDRRGGKPLYLLVLELLQREHAAGATALHGLAGFGASSRIHSSTLVDLAADLPVIVEWVDHPDRVAYLLPLLLELAPDALIITQQVTVASGVRHGLRSLPADLPVEAVMTRAVQTIAPDASIAEAFELLIRKHVRTLPVLNAAGRVVGILTDGDLLERLGLPSAGVHAAITRAELRAEIEALRAGGQTVADLMHSAVITVSPAAPLVEAVHLMTARGVKRLPVTDAEGGLLGLISRVDVLRALAQEQFADSSDQEAAGIPVAGATRVSDIMTRAVPTVEADMPLPAVVSSLIGAAQRRAVVIDKQRRVLGIITDGDLLARATPAERPGLLGKVLQRLNREREEGVVLSPRRAAEVMTSNPVTVTPDTTLQEALRLLLQHEIKRLPVTDAEGRLLGLVGRGAILQALAADLEGAA